MIWRAARKSPTVMTLAAAMPAHKTTCQHSARRRAKRERVPLSWIRPRRCLHRFTYLKSLHAGKPGYKLPQRQLSAFSIQENARNSVGQYIWPIGRSEIKTCIKRNLAHGKETYQATRQTLRQGWMQDMKFEIRIILVGHALWWEKMKHRWGKSLKHICWILDVTLSAQLSKVSNSIRYTKCAIFYTFWFRRELSNLSLEASSEKDAN